MNAARLDPAQFILRLRRFVLDERDAQRQQIEQGGPTLWPSAWPIGWRFRVLVLLTLWAGVMARKRRFQHEGGAIGNAQFRESE